MIEPVFQKTRSSILAWVESPMDTRVVRCLKMATAIEELQTQICDLSRMRSEQVKQMRADGATIRHIAGLLGVSSTRIEQITK